MSNAFEIASIGKDILYAMHTFQVFCKYEFPLIPLYYR